MITAMNGQGEGFVPEVRHAGPPLLLPAIIYTLLMIAGAILLGRGYAAAQGSAQRAAIYAATAGSTIGWGSFFELGSAVPLGIFAATLVSRLRFHGVRAAGGTIALFGGVGAMVMLFMSALGGWSMTRPGVAGSAEAVAVLRALGFASAGPGFAVLMGLFVAGASITSGLHRLVPSWVMVLGLVVAAAGELASLTLVTFTAAWCIPICRFGSIIWMICMAVNLPVRRVRSESSADAVRMA
jgi:hypothetical protein